jgi:hypothetical protein
MAMMVTLNALIDLLSRDGLSVEEVAARVGAIVHDPGPPLPTELAPSLPGVESARLTRDRDSGAPDGLSLGLAPAARPSVAELAAAFGPYRQARMDLERPRTLIFQPPPRVPHRSVALIAELAPGGETAARITLRRDERPTERQEP